MKPEINIRPDKEALSDCLAGEILDRIRDSRKTGREFHLALSGGSTPRLLFERLCILAPEPSAWMNVSIYWVDERCVPPDHPESNYGMTYHAWLGRIGLPGNQIHRIRGEEMPEQEVLRYAGLIGDRVPRLGGLPVFDLVLLGLGVDGHTASIFPGNLDLISSDHYCAHAVHPQSGQSRITLTGRVISNARRITFLVSGADKSRVIRDILEEEGSSADYPAACIHPFHGSLGWYLDGAAARNLRQA
jgi:6-phosphogluconolactonase